LSRGKGKILVEEHPSPITAHLPTHALLIFACFVRSITHPSTSIIHRLTNNTSAASSTPSISISMPKRKAGDQQD
jgi:hypothetical protein